MIFVIKNLLDNDFRTKFRKVNLDMVFLIKFVNKEAKNGYFFG